MPILSLKDCVEIGEVKDESCLISNEPETRGYKIWKKIFQRLMNFNIEVNITGCPIKYELKLKYNGQQHTADIDEEYYAKPPTDNVIKVYISSSDGKLLEEALKQVKEIEHKEDEINLIVGLFSRLKDADDENKIKEIIKRYSSEYSEYNIWSDILKELGELDDEDVGGISNPVSPEDLGLGITGDKETNSEDKERKHSEDKDKTRIITSIKKPKGEKQETQLKKSGKDRSKHPSQPARSSASEQTKYDPNALEEKSKVEKAGMEVVMWWEKHKEHRDPEDVSAYNLGYDIRSKDPKTGEYYYIEVKAFKGGRSRVILTENEYEAARYYGDKYLLYIVENAIENSKKIERGEEPDEPIIVSDPANNCEFTLEKVEQYVLGICRKVLPKYSSNS